MKTLAKYYSVLLMAMVISMSFTSCGSDDSNSSEPISAPVDPNDVVNTTWVETHTSTSGTKSTLTLRFGATTAVYEISVSQDSQTTTQTNDYSFTRSENLVVLKPTKAGLATLEGRIENGLRMSLKNASSGAEIAVLYKQ